MENGSERIIMDTLSDTDGFTYRKILHVDLERDRCTVLKSDPEGWQPGEGPLSGQMARFALDGAVHREDLERFVTFTRLDHLSRACTGGRETQTMIYRRRAGAGYRWARPGTEVWARPARMAPSSRPRARPRATAARAFSALNRPGRGMW